MRKKIKKGFGKLKIGDLVGKLKIGDLVKWKYVDEDIGSLKTIGMVVSKPKRSFTHIPLYKVYWFRERDTCLHYEDSLKVISKCPK